MEKIYKVKTNLTKEMAKDMQNKMTPAESDFISKIKVSAYDYFGEDGLAVSYMLISKLEFLKILHFLKSKGVIVEHSEITEDVLLGKFSFKGTDIEKDVDSFIQKNLTLDNVLDKINLSGVDSLSDYDKNILEKNNK